MSTTANNDILLTTLPNELINMTFNFLNDEDLIMTAANNANYQPIICEILNNRLNRMSMLNMMRAYSIEGMREAINTLFNQLPSSKYQTIKEMFQNETNQSNIQAIQFFIGRMFFQILDQDAPEGMNLIKQIDTIHAVLITSKFIELVDANGGLFHVLNVINNMGERNTTNIRIQMVSVNPSMNNHSFVLNISTGYDLTKCRVSRNTTWVGDVDYDFVAIFYRLCDFINSDYSFDDIKIQTQSVGNTTFGHIVDVSI
jgi:hypothetical protein